MARVRRDVGTTIRWLELVLGAFFLLSCAGSHPPDTTPAPPAPKPRPVAPAPPPVVDAGPPVPDVPRTIAIDAFGEGDRIADLTALGVGDRMLLGWVTYFDEGAAALRKKGRAAPKGAPVADPNKQGASVVVRALDKDGEALSPPKVVSSKAISFGGVALAQGPARGDIGLAWVGKDAGLAQVFVTKLSDTGDKLSQKMITHSKAGCSDVALLATGEGFVVAWVESKGDKAEIFAAKIGRDLARVGAERRVAEAKGEASDVRVIGRGDELLVVWSEARSEGDGGIGAARLSTSDLTVRGDPALVLSAPGHARGIDLSKFGDAVEMAWVEDATQGADAGSSGRALWFARLDSAAKSSAGKTAVQLVAEPSSVAIDCERVCRVVVPVAERGELAIYGFSYDASQKPPVARRLAALSGVSTEDTSPVLVKDWLFFAEDNLRGGGRIRKAKLAW